MQKLDSFLRHYLYAVQASTRVPVKGALADFGAVPSPELVRASAPHAPGAGWLVGMAACVSFAIVSLGLPDVPFTPMAASVACIIATAVMTGAANERSVTHLTGDPLALTLLLLARLALIAVLAASSPAAVLTALLAAHTVSRFWPLVLIRTLAPAIGPIDVVSQPTADTLDRRALVIGAAWCALPVTLMALAHGVGFAAGALALSGLVLWAFRHWLNRGGGYTAASLGTAQQACEVAFYLGAGFGLPGR